MAVRRPAIRAGLIGRGIQRSLTPAMHEAEGRALGLDYSYQLFDMETPAFEAISLPELLERTQRNGFAGLNITHPFKVDVIRYLDVLSETARRLGAVNTVVFQDGKRFGYNTDFSGFKASFQQGFGMVRKDRVLLLGAGGAGSAVAFALLECDVKELLVHDIDHRRARQLVKRLQQEGRDRKIRLSGVVDAAGIHGMNGIVNATTVGMAGNPGTAFPPDLLTPDIWVADIIYFPPRTELLAKARKKGCRILPGSGMAIFQAVHAFELFTGISADPERLRATFNSLRPG